MTNEAPKLPVASNQKPTGDQAGDIATPGNSQHRTMQVKPLTIEIVDTDFVLVDYPNSSDANQSTVSSAERSNVIPESKSSHEVGHQPKDQPLKSMTQGNCGGNCQQKPRHMTQLQGKLNDIIAQGGCGSRCQLVRQFRNDTTKAVRRFRDSVIQGDCDSNCDLIRHSRDIMAQLQRQFRDCTIQGGCCSDCQVEREYYELTQLLNQLGDRIFQGLCGGNCPLLHQLLDDAHELDRQLCDRVIQGGCGSNCKLRRRLCDA